MGKTAENVAICTVVVQGSTYFVEEESIWRRRRKIDYYLYVTLEINVVMISRKKKLATLTCDKTCEEFNGPLGAIPN